MSTFVFKSTDEFKGRLYKADIKERTNPMHVHIHEFFEVHLIVDGEVTQTINGKIYEMKKGDFYFLNPFDFHQYTPRGAVTLAKCQFDLSILDDKIKEFVSVNGHAIVTHIEDDSFDLVKEIFNRLVNEQKNPDKFTDDVARFLISQLAIEALRRYTKVINIASTEKSFNAAIMYIHSHFNENVSLDKVASISGVAPNYFCYIFKKKFGVTFKTYIKNLRLNKAISLLKSVDNRISEIAIACGYSSFSQFTSEFKAYTGTTPKKFRKQ